MNNSTSSDLKPKSFEVNCQKKTFTATQPFDVLQAQMKKVQHPQWSLRSAELALITELIFELTYDEYRLLVGTLNSMRDKYYRTWVELINDLSLFKKEMSTYVLLSGIIDILEDIAHAEMKVENKYDIYLKKQKINEFSANLMSLARLFYSSGINILNPSLSPERKCFLTSNDVLSFHTYSRETIMIRGLSVTNESKSDNSLFEVCLADPYSQKTKVIRLKASEEILIGRGGLKVVDLMGFPFDYFAATSLSVKDSCWSRAALLLSCTSDGRLYLFDRASKNPFKYALFNTKNNISSIIEYDPCSINSQPLGSSKAEGISMSMGSIIELNKATEIPESIRLLMLNRSE